jgi:hypothetical protein
LSLVLKLRVGTKTRESFSPCGSQEKSSSHGAEQVKYFCTSPEFDIIYVNSSGSIVDPEVLLLKLSYYLQLQQMAQGRKYILHVSASLFKGRKVHHIIYLLPSVH